MKIIQILIAFAILAGGAFIAITLISTKPVAEKVAIEQKLPVVETVRVAQSSPVVKIEAQGEIIPPRRTTLSAQVTGKVVYVSEKYEVGGTFDLNELILKIDDADYQNALINAKAAKAQVSAALKDAEVNLLLEQARVAQAKRDWQKLGKGRTASDLLLRKPQIAAAEAKIESAQAALTEAASNISLAERNIERTRIRAPFPCQIESKQIDLGALVTMGSPLLRMYETGRVEARLPISLEDLPFLSLEKGEVPVQAKGQFGSMVQEWQGAVLRSENRIDPSSRSAYIIAGFSGDRIPPVGLFASMSLDGSTMDNIYEIPRIALRNMNQVILVKPDNTLEFRTVTVSRTTKNQVFLSEGVKEGERICITVMNTPVEGMSVSTKND